MPTRKIQELLHALETAGYSRGPSQRHQYAKEIRKDSFSSSKDRVTSLSIGFGPLNLEAQGGMYIEPTPHVELGLGIPTMSTKQAHGGLDRLPPNHLTVPRLEEICYRLKVLESMIGKDSNSSLPILERLDTLEAQRDSVKTIGPNAINSKADVHDFLSESQFESALEPFSYENTHFPMVAGGDHEFGSFIANTQNTSRGPNDDVLSNDSQSLGGQDNEGMVGSFTVTTPSRLSNTQRGRFNCSYADCIKTFARKGDYNRHLRLHGTPQFPCQVPGCDRVGLRGFTRNDKLLVHQTKNH
jgi:hypothetical protein